MFRSMSGVHCAGLTCGVGDSRIDVLLLVLVLRWCWTLRAALAHSCIVPGDRCGIGVLSIVIVTVVMDSACGTNTVLCLCGNH